MASRYGSFARAARSFRHASNRAGYGASRSMPFQSSQSASNSNTLNNLIRRRCVQTMIPLHSAIAASKLVSHLSFNSRSGCALPLGLQGYVNMIPLCTMSREPDEI